MSTRGHTFASEITRRAKAAGWIVEAADAEGYRIREKLGAPSVSVHLTPSDRNAEHSIMRALNDLGFDKAEERAKRKRERERQAKLAADKAANEAALAKAAQQAQSVARAAGPYAPPKEMPLSWFVGEHPSPWHEYVVITPELAKQILDRTNHNNRPKSQATVDKYDEVMRDEMWQLTHEGGAIDDEGNLQDSQHRLMACVQSGQTIEMSFHVGMPAKNMKFIGEGRQRKPSDVVAMTLGSGVGKVGRPTVTATMLRLVYAYEQGDQLAFKRKHTNQQIADRLMEDMDKFGLCQQFAVRGAKRAMTQPGPLAAAMYVIGQANPDSSASVRAFFAGLVNQDRGLNDRGELMALPYDDPRRQLVALNTDRALGHVNTPTHMRMGMIIKCWNLVVADHRVEVAFPWGQHQPVPRVDVQAPGSIPPMLVDEVRNAK